MSNENLLLVDSCELVYIKSAAFPSQRLVRVELLMGGGRKLVRVINTTESDNSPEIMYELNLDRLAAASLVKLGQKGLLARKPARQCLLLIHKTPDTDTWTQLVIVDKEKPTQFNCVAQFYSKVSEICFTSSFTLTKNTDQSVCELQFTKTYVAIVPTDGTHFCENIHSLFELGASLFTGSISRKGISARSLLRQCNTCENSIEVKRVYEMDWSNCINYTLTDSMVLMKIKQECSSHLSQGPLPPLPLPETPEIPSNEVPSITSCGEPPGKLEKPFWLREDRVKWRSSSIYGTIPEFQDEIIYHESRRQEICQREPKKRFRRFVTAVSIKPAMLKAVLASNSKKNHRLYEIPTVSEPVEVPTEDHHFPQDNVESTFAAFLRKIVRYTFHPEQEVCPIGLSTHERELFCWRLDLIEYDVLKGPGWKEFAQHIVSLDNDDLEMIDEFSCKYKCQVVEVLLDHWHKLHKMGSLKCLRPACKSTIISVLHTMQKIALLEELKWQNEV